MNKSRTLRRRPEESDFLARMTPRGAVVHQFFYEMLSSHRTRAHWIQAWCVCKGIKLRLRWKLLEVFINFICRFHYHALRRRRRILHALSYFTQLLLLSARKFRSSERQRAVSKLISFPATGDERPQPPPPSTASSGPSLLVFYFFARAL